jgi:hypothetical protein
VQAELIGVGVIGLQKQLNDGGWDRLSYEFPGNEKNDDWPASGPLRCSQAIARSAFATRAGTWNGWAG